MAQKIPAGYFARNIEPIGYHDLNGKPAFKLAMQEVNSRWYLYVAHLWHRGWSVLDVTDPAAPEFCTFIPGTGKYLDDSDPGRRRQDDHRPRTNRAGLGRRRRPPVHRRIFHFRRERADRAKANRPFPNRQHGHASQFLRRRQSGSCRSRRAGFNRKNLPHRRYRRSGRPARSRPLFVAGAGARSTTNGLKFSCHGPAHIEGNRAYLSYGDGGGIILDVADMSQPKMISQIAFRGITATQGIHTYLPLPRRKMALINDEAIRENGDENLNMAGIVDISDEKRPRMLSLFPLPEPAAGKRLEEFLRESRPLRPTQPSSPESSTLSRRSRRRRLSHLFQCWTESL